MPAPRSSSRKKAITPSPEWQKAAMELATYISRLTTATKQPNVSVRARELVENEVAATDAQIITLGHSTADHLRNQLARLKAQLGSLLLPGATDPPPPPPAYEQTPSNWELRCRWARRVCALALLDPEPPRLLDGAAAGAATLTAAGATFARATADLKAVRDRLDAEHAAQSRCPRGATCTVHHCAPG
jgi:hypothetical protein